MYGEFSTPSPSSSSGGSGSTGGSRRSVRHSVFSDKEENSPWLFRDSEVFVEDLEAQESSIMNGGLLSDAHNRTRRQANNRNSSSNKDNK